MVFLGYVILKRVELWGGLAFLLGFGLIIALPVLHYMSTSWEIGHTVQADIDGRRHDVDWEYSPLFDSMRGTLELRLIYPGYLPLETDRTTNQLRLRVQKSERPYWNKTIFGFDADEARRECTETGSRRYCRFFYGGAWYWVQHQRSDDDSEPPLEELVIEIPALFERFAVSQ